MVYELGNFIVGEDDGLMVLIWDTRKKEVVADSDRLAAKNIRAWVRADDKEERNEKARAARRRPKLIKIVDNAIRALGTAKAEPGEIRDILLRLALLAQTSMNLEREDELLAEIEGAEDKNEMEPLRRQRRVISVGEGNSDD